MQSIYAYSYEHRDGCLSSAEVCERLNITYRQLDYWARRGYIEGQEVAGGSGQRRRWTPAQVERVRQLALAAWVVAGLDHGGLDEVWNRIHSGVFFLRSVPENEVEDW